MDPLARIDGVRKPWWARRWLWPAAVFLAWVLGTIAGIIPGFIVPPAILEGGESSLRVDGETFPRGTELVELRLAGGENLRGVYVPSDPGAPVVLHLLESSGSVSSKPGYRYLLEDLANSGYASLMIDYRGVGASDGTRSPRHLEEDAAAMWSEAVRRAGGDASLVIVRSISIGGLAAASLAERGAHPALWILIAPVRGESVVRHFAQWQYPGVLSRLASSFFRPATSVDLVAATARMGSRLWVDSPRGDELLPEDERADLRAAVVGAGGTWARGATDVSDAPSDSPGKPQTVFISFGAIHVMASIQAHRLLLPDESNLLEAAFPSWPDREAGALAALADLRPELSERFPRGSDARTRLGRLASTLRSVCAERLAAFAFGLHEVSIAEQLVRLDLYSEHPWLEDLGLDDLLRVLDLDDPAGRLPESLLLDWVLAFSEIRRQGVETACYASPERVTRLARSSEAESAAGEDRLHEILGPKQNGWSRYPCCALWRTLVVELGRSPAEARRQATRILLKAAGIPDRVVPDSGGLRLEVRDHGGWLPIDLDWPATPNAKEHPGAGDASSR